MLDGCLQDVRYAVRGLRRNPLFTLTAALSLAIGIGANTTIFSIANALLFKPPSGVVEAHRLVDIGRSQDGQGFDNSSYPNFLDIRSRTTTLAGVYAYRLGAEPMGLGGRDGAERIYGGMVSTNYFAVLGTKAFVGRLFAEHDSEEAGAAPIAVLSYQFWQRRFNGDAAVVGQTLTLNGHPFAVVGVAPAGFHGTTVLTADLWLPINMVGEVSPRRASSILTSRQGVWLVMGGRLKPGVSTGQAQAELAGIGQALEREFPNENRGKGIRVVPSSPIPGNGAPVAGFLGVLLGIVGLVLAIACANVAGILLARATARRREIAVRIAIGAGRWRLVRQMLVESTLLFLAGGVAGLALARVMTTLLVSLLPTLPVPLDLTLALDGRAVAFTLGLSLVAAVLSGLAPALHVSRSAVLSGLKTDTGGPERQRLRHVFVVGQVAFSIMLVVGAGLFVRALQRAAEIDPGFDPRGLELAALDLSLGGYTDESGRVFASQLAERVRRLPGVESATLSAMVPLGLGGLGLGGLAVPGAPAVEGRRFIDADWNVVTPGYFQTMRLPLATGRDFTDGDRDGTAPVVIVNETAARRFWPGVPAPDVVGKVLLQQAGRPEAPDATRTLTVIAVARDSRVPQPGRRSPAIRLRADRAAVHAPHDDHRARDARSTAGGGDPRASRVAEPEPADRCCAELRRLRLARTYPTAYRGVGVRQPRRRRPDPRGDRHLRRHRVHGDEPHPRDRYSDGARCTASRRRPYGAPPGDVADARRRGDRPGTCRRGEPAAGLAPVRRGPSRSAGLRRVGAPLRSRRAPRLLCAGPPRDAD